MCGFGRADKGQMLRMVTAILGLDPPPATDHAADALAVGGLPRDAVARADAGWRSRG